MVIPLPLENSEEPIIYF